jgi:hypothetical protein
LTIPITFGVARSISKRVVFQNMRMSINKNGAYAPFICIFY